MLIYSQAGIARFYGQENLAINFAFEKKNGGEWYGNNHCTNSISNYNSFNN